MQTKLMTKKEALIKMLTENQHITHIDWKITENMRYNSDHEITDETGELLDINDLLSTGYMLYEKPEETIERKQNEINHMQDSIYAIYRRFLGGTLTILSFTDRFDFLEDVDD